MPTLSRLFICGVLLALLCGCSSESVSNDGGNQSANSLSHEETSQVIVETQWPEEVSSVAWLVRNSSAVIRGTVTGISDPFEATDVMGQLIVCHDVEIAVSNSIKGSHRRGETVTVRVRGGSFEGFTYVDDDQPVFTIGEDVLVMLAQNEWGGYGVTGAFSGKFHMENEVARRDDARVPTEMRGVGIGLIEAEAHRE